MAKRLKFNNVKTTVDGIKFDSKKEAKRYGELKLLIQAKEIYALKTQVKYDFIINDFKVCSYIADFTYKSCETDQLIVEDVKSEITRKAPVYRIKNKLMKAIYGITILEK